MPLQIVTFEVEEDLFKQARTIGILIGKPIQEIIREALRFWVEAWEDENEINGDYLS
jgi:hypothetical protein